MSTNQTRTAGTRTVNPSGDLSPGDTLQIPLHSLTGGPRNKEGYLRRFLPFDAVVFDSYHSERIQGSITGRNFDPVPSNAARTFDSVKVNTLYIKVPSGNSNTLSAGDLDLILFNSEENVSSGARWSLSQAIEDSIPGFSFGVRTDR